MTYRITTDRTTDMPASYYESHGVTAIGLGYQIGGKEYVEGTAEDLPSHEFYEQLRHGVEAKTMQINSFQFIEMVEPILKAGEDVLHVAFSSGLSGTYASCEAGAAELREKYPERQIVVVDTLAASMGEGLLLDYAVKNRDKGMSLQENADWLLQNRLHLCHWFTVDDLMYLHRGGRVSKTSAIFGSLLGIKPVLHMDNDGHLILMSKVRGRKASLQALVNKMVETGIGDLSKQTVFISHGDCPEDAEFTANLVREKTGATDIHIHPVGTVIGSHSGPGTLALFFLGRER